MASFSFDVDVDVVDVLGGSTLRALAASSVGGLEQQLNIVCVARPGLTTSPRTYAKRTYAICVCSCDNKKIEVLPEQLRKGDVQSCGCYQKESAGNRFRTHGKSHTREFDLWAAAKERADKHGIDFNIDVEDIVIPEVCPVLGIPINISLGRGRRQPDSPSLDKFYPEKGYVKGNIQVISWRANRIKSDGTPDEWIKIATWCQEEDVKKKLDQQL